MQKKSLTIPRTQAELAKVSKTFCGAKWSQVLFQLHLGKLHNCCLTPGMEIDKEAFFEGQKLVEQREAFLRGERVSDCSSCWDAEDQGFVSDRVYKSSEPNVGSLFSSGEAPATRGIIPTYVEISLSNRCQFKCAYCSPENSSSLYGEMKEFGPYRTTEDFGFGDHLSRGENFFLENDSNPYVDRFIEWFPRISRTLEVLRFTGGEPLLSQKLFDLLDLLIQHPSPELELIFNSNLGVQPKVLDQFIHKLKSMPKGSYGQLTFITSIDGWGSGAELARWGLDLKAFEKNLLTIRENFPGANIRVTSTINLLALPDLKALLVKMIEWKQAQQHSDQILLTSYPLHYPAFLSPAWCFPSFENEVSDALTFLDEHFVGDEQSNGFKSVEKEMLLKALAPRNENRFRKNELDFTLFMLQHQSRKGWDESILPDSVKNLLHAGVRSLEVQLASQKIDPLLAAKCIAWITCDQKLIQSQLEPLIMKGTLNSWALIDILVQTSKSLDPHWVEWCYQLGLIEHGNVLLKNDEFASRVNIPMLIMNNINIGKKEFWIGLMENENVFSSLNPVQLKKMYVLCERPFLDEQFAFFHYAKSKHPGL